MVGDFWREYHVTPTQLWDLPTEDFLLGLAGLSPDSAWRTVVAAELEAEAKAPREVTGEAAMALIDSL